MARKKAVDSIYTVTRTMEMVATARFKQAFRRFTVARDYIRGCGDLVGDILLRSDRSKLSHPLLHPESFSYKKESHRVVLVITSDRGLCGGYNMAVLRLAAEHLAKLDGDGQSRQLHMAGDRGIRQMRADGYDIAETHAAFEGKAGEWHAVSRLADRFISGFLDMDISGVDIVYSQLIGTGRHEPAIHTLLPLELPEPPDCDEWELKEILASRVEYEFVPSVKIMLERLLPTTVRLQLFQCFMEAAVTEQIARMGSMRAASESAEEMIQNLNVKYNRTRQSQITTELTEILGGRVALE